MCSNLEHAQMTLVQFLRIISVRNLKTGVLFRNCSRAKAKAHTLLVFCEKTGIPGKNLQYF